MDQSHEFIHQRIGVEIDARRKLEIQVVELKELINKLITHLNYDPHENQDQ